MFLASVVVAALLTGIPQGAAKSVKVDTYAQGGWLLTVQTDTFAHQTTCWLADRNGQHSDITVDRQFITFHFGSGMDTTGAWYAIDKAPARAWRAQITSRIDRGDMAEAESLANPTLGLMAVPVEELNDAQTVIVRPMARGRLRAFDLSTLWPILASGNELGCRFSQATPG